MLCIKMLSISLVLMAYHVVYCQQSVKPASITVRSSTQLLPAYKPTRIEVLKRYRQAAMLDSAIRNKVYRSSVQANWQADGETFWYRNTLKDTTLEYIYVDARAKVKRKAFDHERLANALTRQTGKRYDATRLGIANLLFENNGQDIIFQLDDKWWKTDLVNYQITSTTAPAGIPVTDTADRRPLGRGNFNRNELGPLTRRARAFRSDSLSPDKLWIAFERDGNLFVKPANAAEESQLTTDGNKEKAYGNFSWSPDSKALVAYHTNPVVTKQVHYVLTSLSGTRGELRSRGYAQPGDENSSYEMFVFNIADKRRTRVAIDTINFSGPPLVTWRKDDNRFLNFEKVDRGHQRFRIVQVNRETGEARDLVDEKTNTFIFEQRIFTFHMPDSKEILWVSEKDGWRHIYLIDAMTGTEKGQVTKGKWVVRDIDSIDQVKREIWFQASGMNTAEDPYFIHYYRVGFDGKGLTKLTEEKANHRASFSPNRKYFIDTYSRVDKAPVIELKRTEDGTKVMDLEKGDISAYLATGIRLPEVFHAKGRDGKTDIWGVVFRPRILILLRNIL